MGRRDKKNAEENPPVLPKTPTKASMSTDDPAPPSTPPPTTPTFTLNQSPRTPKGSVWKRFAAVGRVMLAVTPKLTPAPVASTSAIPEASPLSHLTSRIFEFSAPPPNWFEAPPSPSSPSFRYPFFPLRHNAKPTPAISSVTKRARSDSSLSEMGSPVKELKRLRLATPSEDGSIDSDSDATGSAITSLTSDNDDRGGSPDLKEPSPTSFTAFEPADAYDQANATPNDNGTDASGSHEVAAATPDQLPYLDSAAVLAADSSLTQGSDEVPTEQAVEVTPAFSRGDEDASVNVQSQQNVEAVAQIQMQETGLPVPVTPPDSDEVLRALLFHPQQFLPLQVPAPPPLNHPNQTFNGPANPPLGSYGQQFAAGASNAASTSQGHGWPVLPYFQAPYPPPQQYRQYGYPHPSLATSMNAQLNGSYHGQRTSSAYPPPAPHPTLNHYGASIPPSMSLPPAIHTGQAAASTSTQGMQFQFKFDTGIRKPSNRSKKSTNNSKASTTRRRNIAGPSNSSDSSPATESPKVPRGPLTAGEKTYIWCGHQTAEEVGTNHYVSRRCTVRILRTQQDIHNHYLSHHGMDLTLKDAEGTVIVRGGLKKCNWTGSCSISMKGENLARHIFNAHIRGSDKLCESKYCTFNRAANGDWCNSSQCGQIAPISANDHV